MPDGVGVDEVHRLQGFLRCDEQLEDCYRRSKQHRPPESILSALASTAMTAYDQQSAELPIGWQKLLVLRAGIAGAPENLDSGEIQRWVYKCLFEEHPEWIEPYNPDGSEEPPLRWLRRITEHEINKIKEVDRLIASDEFRL